MTINKQFYLCCNGCGKVYMDKSECPVELEESAEDDGWEVYGSEDTDQENVPMSFHKCPGCINKQQ